MPRVRVLLVSLLLLGLPLAGCIGKGDDPVPAATDDALDNRTGNATAVLPDGRGESAGLLETNKTEEGIGGIEHKHDYWKGAEQVVLLDQPVFLACPPCMPDGEGTQPKAVAYVKLPDVLPGSPEGSEDYPLVYEGAERVELLFGAPLVGDVPHPAPPGVFVQYRSAADGDWRDPMPVTFDAPMVIDVTPQMTDVPHSLRSLWVFRLTTDRPEVSMQVPFKVTVFKGREVVDWPGHPDFYADADVRKVMEQHVTTHMSGLESFALYDSGGTWASPEKLISWGTTKLHVFLNVTKTTNAYNAAATGYFLEAHNATIIGPEVTFGDRYFEVNDKNDLAAYEFMIDVPAREDGRPNEGLDGPYQPTSRWGFRAMATFADIPGVTGLCPGCFPYDIEYDIVVLAIHDPEAGGA